MAIRARPGTSLLLTGATGFIGTHLLPHIRDAYGIATLGRSAVLSYPHVPMDLGAATESPSMPVVDQVIHLAALTQKTHQPIRDPQAFHRVNVQGTGRLLRLLESSPVSHFVYVSTCDVYAPSTDAIDEQSPTHADSPYSRSKLEAEAMVAQWCEQRGITCAIVRPGNIYGPGDQAYGKLIPVATRTALAHRPIAVLGSGRALRDVLYVTDMARAIAVVARARASGIFNGVSGRATSVRRICELVNELAGNRAGLEYADPGAPESNRIFATSRLTTLGWRPLVSLEQGLANDIDALRMHDGLRRPPRNLQAFGQ